MMKKSMLLLLTCLGANAFAGTYLGFNVGYASNQFNNAFGPTGATGMPNLNMTSSQMGLTAGFQLGYRYNLGQKFNLAGELVGGINGTTATSSGINTLFPSSNYKLSHKLRYNYGVNVLPGFMVAKNVNLYAVLGYQRGVFRLSSSVGTQYVPVNKTVSGLNYGLGTAVTLTNNLDLNMSYQYTRYQNIHVASTSVYYVNARPIIAKFVVGVNYNFSV